MKFWPDRLRYLTYRTLQTSRGNKSMTAGEIADHLYGAANGAQIVSVRHVLRALEQEGYVARVWAGGPGMSTWAAVPQFDSVVDSNGQHQGFELIA